MMPALLPSLRTAASCCRASSLEIGTESLLRVYRLSHLSRVLDDIEIALKHQNHAFFQISGAGHELMGAMASLWMEPSRDWFFPYYRDRAFCLGVGITPLAMLKQSVGAGDCVASMGRQMPSHWSDPDLHVVSESSPTGVQFITAAGVAEGLARYRERAGIVYCSAGEGATSEGWFYEGLSLACLHKLPVVYAIHDNGYAISVPVSQQTPGGCIGRLVSGFPDLWQCRFDGCCPLATSRAWDEAIRYVRAGRGPALLQGIVTRPYHHSLSDDGHHYLPPAVLERMLAADPLEHIERCLREHVEVGQLERIRQEVVQEAKQARSEALACPRARPDSVSLYIFSPTLPADAAVFSGDRIAVREDGPKITMVEAIRQTLMSEMARDEEVVVFGQDVADAENDALLEQVSGKGGVFRVTLGLQRRFGENRVFNTPLSEAGIVGRAIGMSLVGKKPVAEIQFFDYIFPAMMHIRSELAALRWRSANGFCAPVVIRCPYGGYLRGGAVYHSQTGESIFAQQHGLRIALPSCAADAVGLLRTAIRCEDPVLFLEHKHLYRQGYARNVYPGDDYCLPFGQGRICREGRHITVVTYGALVEKCLQAAQGLLREWAIEIEVIDLRTLVPFDLALILESVKKTSKVCVVHEESVHFGFGAEIASQIQEKMFYDLDAPVMRIGSANSFVPYYPELENTVLPQVKNITAKLLELYQI